MPYREFEQRPHKSHWRQLDSNSQYGVKKYSRITSTLAVTDFTVTMERSAVMTFAHPITESYHSLFIKNPSEAYNLNAYTDPLHYLSWIVIITFCVCTPPVIFLTTRLLLITSMISFINSILFRYGETDPHYLEFTLAKSYVFSIGTLLMRCWSDVPKTAASRCAFIWYQKLKKKSIV
jgi:hypothetical protein